MRVLVVDDDVVVPMQLALELDDVEIVDAVRIVDALDLAARQRFDAIVVDRRLPDGDGASLVRQLRFRRRTGQTPVVIVTAAYDPADEVAMLRAGADAYLGKPFDARTVRAYLRAVSEHPAAQRRSRRQFAAACLAAGSPAPPLVIDLADPAPVPDRPRRWWQRRATAPST